MVPRAMASIKEVCWMKLACKLGLPMTMRKPSHVTAAVDGGVAGESIGDGSEGG